MSRVKLDVIKPWINQRVSAYLNGLEDDVVVEFVFNQVGGIS
jgi:serine/arginine repetitive matrix protein 1